MTRKEEHRMRKSLLVVSAFATLAMTSCPVHAGSKGSGGSHRKGTRREVPDNGSLTPDETRILRREQQSMDHRRRRAMGDGQAVPGESSSIDHAQVRSSHTKEHSLDAEGD